MATHVVKKGESLSTIARQYGHSDWKAIYDHPANAGFKKKRPNPNVIHPGDVVVIPDKPILGLKRAPINDEDFVSIAYSISYRSENGRLSKYLQAIYADGAQRDIQIDGITPAQPRLW